MAVYGFTSFFTCRECDLSCTFQMTIHLNVNFKYIDMLLISISYSNEINGFFYKLKYFWLHLYVNFKYLDVLQMSISLLMK